MANDEQKLAWDLATSEEWRQTVEGWRWKPIGGGDWAKSGPCQRCGHTMAIKDEERVEARMIGPEEINDLELLQMAEVRPIARVSDSGPQFYARCDCGEEHPGRLNGVSSGCGRWGYITPPPRDE